MKKFIDNSGNAFTVNSNASQLVKANVIIENSTKTMFFESWGAMTNYLSVNNLKSIGKGCMSTHLKNTKAKKGTYIYQVTK